LSVLTISDLNNKRKTRLLTTNLYDAEGAMKQLIVTTTLQTGSPCMRGKVSSC